MPQKNQVLVCLHPTLRTFDLKTLGLALARVLHIFSFSDILITMEFLTVGLLGILPWAHIVLSIVLVASILLQQTGAGVGGAMGGGDDSVHYTRRGMEKGLFYISIVIAILFALSAFVVLLINK